LTLQRCILPLAFEPSARPDSNIALPRGILMNRISTRTTSLLSVLSLAVAMTAFSQPASAADTLSTAQVNTLAATAKTPAEHQRLADYYQAQAQSYLAQAAEHNAMIAAYKANPSTKHQASTITHCANLVASLNELAAKSTEQAKLHQQMATEAGARN
jgi:hypothetical protein